MRGPLPDANRRRTNASPIPTTNLPASGRSGRTPTPPKWILLGPAGQAWWRWAWHTPQACAWGPGHEVAVARRASLEDDLVTLAAVESLDLADVLGVNRVEFRAVVSQLAALATGRLAVCREIRELDDRLGLTPKAMAALRWQIVEAPVDVPVEDEVSRRRKELRDRFAG